MPTGVSLFVWLLAGLPVMDDQEHDADERDTDEHHDEIPDGHRVILAGGRTSLV
jgi:hypothetical protein